MLDFSAHIANLGKYNAGILADTVLSFPTTTEQVQAALRSISVDGLRYEEIIITEYDTSIPKLAAVLPEYASLDELNYLAGRLYGMSQAEQDLFAAAIQHGEYTGNLQDLINLTHNLSCYDLIPGIKDYEAYGWYLVDNRREFYLPRKARFYFDFAQYGEETAINEGGDLTPQGYIFNNRSPFRTVYDGRHIPQEYRVFRYPAQAKARVRTPIPKRDMPSR